MITEEKLQNGIFAMEESNDMPSGENMEMGDDMMDDEKKMMEKGDDGMGDMEKGGNM